jgi:hypothetical protein
MDSVPPDPDGCPGFINLFGEFPAKNNYPANNPPEEFR